MLEDAIFTLVGNAIRDGMPARTTMTVLVVQRYQPQTTGVRSGAVVYMDLINARRIGSLRREDNPKFPKPVVEFTHRETQWWEVTLQISALHRRNPEKPAEMELPSAMDIAKIASDILQGDRGLNFLAAQRVRPLRITELRKVPFVNDSDQWEAMPSFDLTLSYPETVETTTPAATVTPNVTRV